MGIEMRQSSCVVLIALSLSACASPGVTIKRTVPKGEVWELAVFPLKDAPGAEGSGRTVTDLLVTELLGIPQYNLIDKGLAEKELSKRAGGKPSDMDAMLRAGRELGADAVLVGEVTRYRNVRAFIFPPADVAVNLRLVEVKTGHVAWSAQHRRTYGFFHWISSLVPIPITMIPSLMYSPNAPARAQQCVADVAGKLKHSYSMSERAEAGSSRE